MQSFATSNRTKSSVVQRKLAAALAALSNVLKIMKDSSSLTKISELYFLLKREST